MVRQFQALEVRLRVLPAGIFRCLGFVCAAAILRSRCPTEKYSTLLGPGEALSPDEQEAHDECRLQG